MNHSQNIVSKFNLRVVEKIGILFFVSYLRRNPHGKIVVNCKTCCYKGEYVCQELKKEVGSLDLSAEIKNFTYEASYSQSVFY